MNLPTAGDINIYNSLDEQWAVKRFLGKTLKEAEALFKQNSSSACEDLLWMGPKAFCFYVQAAISYIQSADAEGDKSMACSFQHPVEHHWEYDREAVASVLPAICDALQYVIDNWAKFDDDEWGIGVYRNVPKHCRQLLQKLTG